MSVVADAKRNWLEQVKADAEEITRKRMAENLPKLAQVAEQFADQPKEAKQEEAPAEQPKKVEAK